MQDNCDKCDEEDHSVLFTIDNNLDDDDVKLNIFCLDEYVLIG